MTLIKPPTIKDASIVDMGRFKKLFNEPVPSATSVRQAINILSRKLGQDANPVFSGITLTGLTASRLAWTDSDKVLESKDLIDLIAGTANRVTIADDTSGGVVVTTPQDTHVDAHMELAGLTIKDSNDDIVFYVDNDEMYFTKIVSIPIAAGHGMPWLFWFTYAAP